MTTTLLTPSAAVPAQNEIAVEPAGRATYCPEDNKLRLYVGRVPREEYLKLRAEGWTALHKQREAGGGDFVAGANRFRTLRHLADEWHDIPAGAFRAEGTSVATYLFRITKTA